MRLISDYELLQLLIDSERLRRLDAAGVDNWSWYGEALSENDDFGKSFSDWEDIDAKELLKEYPEYNI